MTLIISKKMEGNKSKRTKKKKKWWINWLFWLFFIFIFIFKFFEPKITEKVSFLKKDFGANGSTVYGFFDHPN